MKRIVKTGMTLEVPFVDIEGSKLSVLDLYKLYGTECVHHLNGAYAFVVYDAEKQILFGAIDRMGAKSLYYYVQGNEFGYSTSLLPLCENKKFHIDEYARRCYFAMQYVPAPHTIVREVKKLHPGECFTYDLNTGKLETKIYWDLYDNTCHFSPLRLQPSS